MTARRWRMVKALFVRPAAFALALPIVEQILQRTRDKSHASDALALIAERAPGELANLAPRLLTADASWITFPAISSWLLRHRQDLLTPYLDPSSPSLAAGEPGASCFCCRYPCHLAAAQRSNSRASAMRRSHASLTRRRRPIPSTRRSSFCRCFPRCARPHHGAGRRSAVHCAHHGAFCAGASRHRCWRANTYCRATGCARPYRHPRGALQPAADARHRRR